MHKIITILLVVLFSTSVLAAPNPDQSYARIHPPLVVNLDSPKNTDKLAYGQILLSVSVPTLDDVYTIKQHMPQIRHELLMLYSGYELEPLKTQSGREKLAKLSLKKIQTILENEEGKPLATEVLFTKFVFQ